MGRISAQQRKKTFARNIEQLRSRYGEPQLGQVERKRFWEWRTNGLARHDRRTTELLKRLAEHYGLASPEEFWREDLPSAEEEVGRDGDQSEAAFQEVVLTELERCDAGIFDLLGIERHSEQRLRQAWLEYVARGYSQMARDFAFRYVLDLVHWNDEIVGPELRDLLVRHLNHGMLDLFPTEMAEGKSPTVQPISARYGEPIELEDIRTDEQFLEYLRRSEIDLFREMMDRVWRTGEGPPANPLRKGMEYFRRAGEDPFTAIEMMRRDLEEALGS